MKTYKKWLLWIPAAAVMFWIFYMSHMSGQSSASLSGGIAKKVVDVVSNISPAHAKGFRESLKSIEAVIRKFAHIAEYGLLGGCLVLPAAFHLNRRGKRLAGFCILFSFLYACSDELHQLFVLGRSGRFFDIGMDTLGACAGTLLVMAALRKWLRPVKEKNL